MLLVLSDSTFHMNRISGVIVRALALNAIDCEFEPRSCQDFLNLLLNVTYTRHDIAERCSFGVKQQSLLSHTWESRSKVLTTIRIDTIVSSSLLGKQLIRGNFYICQPVAYPQKLLQGDF